ncbi:MAG: UvrD-helicase domain-containing protein [Candidatus Kapaibacteriota bacterium]
MKFTKEQYATLVNDRNQIVIANAGSGKTTILVEKYLNLILNKDIDEIKRIVAITFTKKAASEMKDRLIERINEEIERLKSENLSTSEFLEKNRQLINIREHISSAKIQTIHSFSQELLKEFSIVVGYNPIFSIIDDSDYSEIFDNVFLEIFEEIIINPNYFDIDLNLIFDAINQNKLFDIIQKIVKNDEIYEYLHNQFYDNNRETFINLYYKNLTYYFNENNKICIYLLNKHIENIRQDSKKESYEQIVSLLNQLNLEDEPLNYYEYYIKVINLWKEIKKIKISGNSTIKKYLGDDFAEFNTSYNMMLSHEAIKYWDIYYDILLNIFKFSEIIHTKIEEYKRENSLITYNDMLWKTYKLLQNNEVAEKIREKYDYILVDEFQDTDNIQYDILSKIIPSLKEINNKSKLFVVGDPKQSIYGFRNADVRVIKSTEKDITTVNADLLAKNKITSFSDLKLMNQIEKRIELNEAETLGKIELKISHRLNILNTAFINFLFSKLMQNNDFDYAVNYNPFIYARKTPIIDKLMQLNEIEIENCDSTNGSINFLISINTVQKENSMDEVNDDSNVGDIITNNSAEDETDDESEAKLTVNYIKSLLSNKTKIWDSKVNDYRELQIKDIGILVRKMTNISNLTHLLNKEGIPYLLNDNDKFFDSQEVIDIINYLKFLYNKNDDLTFASLLKSNFFGLTDYEIYELRKFNENQSIWNSLNSLALSNKKYKKIIDEINIILTSHQNLTIQELVDKILENSNYLTTYRYNPLFNVIKLNINNFLEYIKKITEKNKNSLSDLLKEIEKSTKYSNYDINFFTSDENSLNILTIHKSKGLEFPVVILYNTNSKTPLPNDILFHEKFGLNFGFSAQSENGDLIDVKMPTYELCRNYLIQKDIEESKRLLYVALTRAKDILTITTSLTRYIKNGEEKYGSSNGLFKLILNGFDLDTSDFVNKLTNHNLYFEEIVQIYSENQTNNIKVKGNIIGYTSIESEVAMIPEQLSQEIENKDYLIMEEIKQDEPIGKFSASKLQTYLHKYNEFVERYLFQYPDIFFVEEKYSPSGRLLTAADRGTIIHNIMMNINKWYIDKYININAIDEIISKYQRSCNILLNNDDKLNIIKEISSIVDSKFIQNNINNLVNARFEYELNIPLFNNLLKVIFDVLIQNSNNEFEIWDWKSNKIIQIEDVKKIAKYYELQMKIYTLVLSYLYPHNVNYKARLFFTNFASKAKNDSEWIVSFEWTKKELNEFENELQDLMNQTKEVEVIQKYLIDN